MRCCPPPPFRGTFLQNFESYLELLTKNRISGHLKDDIHVHQSYSDRGIFTAVSNEVRRRTVSSSISLTALKKKWLTKEPSWYEGAATDCPSTNNGIEATKAVIRQEHTLRERLSVEKFLECVSYMVDK